MDEQRVKENCVSLVHYEVHAGIVLLIVLDTVEHYVHSTLPLRVAMWLQGAFVGAWKHDQTAIAPVNVLHRSPSSHNAIAGPKGEIVQILVHRVP